MRVANPALTVVCPTCWAAPGELCVTKSGESRSGYSHTTRKREARGERKVDRRLARQGANAHWPTPADNERLARRLRRIESLPTASRFDLDEYPLAVAFGWQLEKGKVLWCSRQD